MWVAFCDHKGSFGVFMIDHEEMFSSLLMHIDRMNVVLNGEVLEDVNQFKYLGTFVAADGVETDVCNGIKEGCLGE